MRCRAFSLFAAVVYVASYAVAATPSIGTVTARGETQIDRYPVKGSGTVFDGSVVETGQTAQSVADLRLSDGSVITLYVGSRGIVYRDHFVLQQGRAQVSASNSYRVEVTGLLVTPSGNNGNEVVSIEPGNAVDVVAQTEGVVVTGPTGSLIAQLHPGDALEFSPISGNASSDFSATGLITADHGHYYLKASKVDVTYELKGSHPENYVGDQVSASGKVDSSLPPAGVAATVDAESIVDVAQAGLHSLQNKVIVSGLSIGDSPIKTLCGFSGPPGQKGPPPPPPPFCYGKRFGGMCCPRTTATQEDPPLCCPDDHSFGYCCPGQSYPKNKCHHSH